jgi:hypothetical protein
VDFPIYYVTPGNWGYHNVYFDFAVMDFNLCPNVMPGLPYRQPLFPSGWVEGPHAWFQPAIGSKYDYEHSAGFMVAYDTDPSNTIDPAPDGHTYHHPSLVQRATPYGAVNVGGLSEPSVTFSVAGMAASVGGSGGGLNLQLYSSAGNFNYFYTGDHVAGGFRRFDWYEKYWMEGRTSETGYGQWELPAP